MNDESLNLREALRLAREKANRERNRAKCKRYTGSGWRKGTGMGVIDFFKKLKLEGIKLCIFALTSENAIIEIFLSLYQ